MLVLLREESSADSGCNVANLTSTYHLEAFSTTTLKMVASATIASQAVQLMTHLPIDQVRHRVFVPNGPVPNAVDIYSLADLLAGHPTLTPVQSISYPNNAALAEAGEAGSGSPAGLANSGNPTGFAGDTALVPDGMYYDPGSDALYVVETQFYGGLVWSTGPHGPEAEDVYAARLDVATGTMSWFLPLGYCAGPAGQPLLAGDSPIVVNHAAGVSILAVGCLASRVPVVYPGSAAGGGGSGISGTGAMLSYSIPLDQSGNPVQSSITFVVGRTNVLFATADPTAGRLFWISDPPVFSTASSAAGPAAVVYDPIHAAYVGAPTVGVNSVLNGGFAAAAGGGRLYAVGPNGFTLADASATPAGEGSVVPGYSCTAAALDVDTQSRRLLVQPFQSCAAFQSKAPFVLVYEDDVPNIPPPAPANPDGYTTQVQEQVGVTTSQYSGAASATGTRLRLVGGTTGLLNGDTSGGYGFLQGVVSSTLGPSTPTVGDASTRELDLGVVSGSSLDNFQAAAQATVATVDQTTGQPTCTPSGVPTSPPTSIPPQCTQQWPFGQSTCNNASGPAQQSPATSYGYDSSSALTCDYTNGSVTTTSTAGPLGITTTLAGQSSSTTLPIAVGQSRSDTTVALVPSFGMVSSSHSIVKNVDLGVVTIGAVEASTTCAAHGHTGSADCTYHRTISGVAASGSPLAGGACEAGQLPTSPPTVVDTCGPLLAALNSIDPGQIVFTMSIPDQQTGYYGGSPGGYQAVSQREEYGHLQDQTINYDDSLLVPGLEMLYVNDSATAPSRLDVQLANTEAGSHYGIQPAPPGTTIPGDTGTSSGGGGSGAAAAILAGTTTSTNNTATAPVGSAGGPFGAFGEMLQRVWSGLQWLVRSPVTGFFVLLLLSLLSTPLVTAWRRSRLLTALREAVT